MSDQSPSSAPIERAILARRLGPARAVLLDVVKTAARRRLEDS